MKTSLKIFLLAAALIVMNGCSAQKRAERHLRRAVALCPELVQVKAHPVDTVLTVKPWADMTAVPLAKVLGGDTLYAATSHGTFVVSLRRPDSALRVGFVAAPQQVRYRDTLRYAQLTMPDTTRTGKGNAWRGVALWTCGLALGLALCLWLLRYALKDNHSTNKNTNSNAKIHQPKRGGQLR